MGMHNNYLKVLGRAKGADGVPGAVKRSWIQTFDDTSAPEALYVFDKAKRILLDYRMAGLVATLSVYHSCKALPSVERIGETHGG